jgi:mannose-6-phosphate isomerase-like protein (cupin superfamily)
MLRQTEPMPAYDPAVLASSLDPFDFHEFAPFNGASFAVFHGDDVDASDWELHPDTDEFLFVVRGSVTVEILGAQSSDRHDLTAGQFVVVPRGLWHRHVKIRDLTELYFTPGESMQSTATDPREQQ